MRNFQLPGRSTVHSTKGMAATSHPLASYTAINILKDGGNAVDAAIAACAVLGVVEPQSTGIGGDCFALYAPKGVVPPIAINGSGRAPQGASVEKLLELGIRDIGLLSPHSVTVPGAVDAWSQLLNDYGTKSLSELLLPAIAYAEEGYVVAPRVAVDWVCNEEKLSLCPNASRIFLPNGRAPRAGEVHRQIELAKSLKRIAVGGRDEFYNGSIAEDIVSHLRSLGSLITLDDFSKYHAEYVDPIKTNYRGFDVFECPPNGQGIVALIILNILQGFDLARLKPNGKERIHLEAEASNLAYRDRDGLLGDPEAGKIPTEYLLSNVYSDALRSLILSDRVIRQLPPPGEVEHQDTVYLTVIDNDRNAISLINSTFHPFGSGICSPATGVMLQNRGSSFVLNVDHPNCIEPGKRPLHTIIPGILAKDEIAVMAFGVMGGHYQAVGHAHFLTNFIDFNMDIQEALDAPRGFAFDGVLSLERGISNDIIRHLGDIGHKTQIAEMPIGGGQAILIDWEQGTLTGASDPRKDGCALGY